MPMPQKVQKKRGHTHRHIALNTQDLVGAESDGFQFSMLLHLGLAVFLHYSLLLSSVINTIARLF
jgi:hypothetical protein